MSSREMNGIDASFVTHTHTEEELCIYQHGTKTHIIISLGEKWKHIGEKNEFNLNALNKNSRKVPTHINNHIL